MGYYIRIIPREKIVWEKERLLQLLTSAGLAPHPEYPEEFLVADAGVAYVREDKCGMHGHVVDIRVGTASDPDEYMQVLRPLAAHLDGLLEFEQNPSLSGIEPMTRSIAESIHWQMSKSEEAGLVRELESKAVNYAHHRAEWMLVTTQERIERDAARTRAHDAFIDAVNILARAMSRAGEDIHWRDKLGDDRKRIGDFACYLHLMLSLDAR